ncbi:hypothetical protein KR222_001287 [Zaprionus bogoriensis]|nr:hypothetical protein KR222_001287 [Zaprionus bogoriensis]
MLINLKVKTLDARTHEFSIDNEITIRQFKDQIAEKTNIAAENQRIIYQGRVLADDKQVKEYGESLAMALARSNNRYTHSISLSVAPTDVDGKVLHVAERPPFSQRGANATNNDEPMRFRNMAGRPMPRNLRNSPYFRALDGMLVGTMAIPVNNGGPLAAPGTRTPPNRFPHSSSFCINRITVAQHMIDCANNIAAYLENPEVGLNNQSLDILQRGRWTMESTVVEVGVSSTDMPRNNNIIDMVQDAVTAALSRNTTGRNYTVVQLPTVYTNEGGEAAGSQQRAAGNEAGSDQGAVGGANTGGSDTSEETTAAAAVIIEDVIETDDEAADGGPTMQGDDERSSSPQEAAGGASSSAAEAADNASNVAVTGIGPRRRTRPQILGNVIQRYRTVQTRLSPFVDRYYEILEQDPVFEEHDTAGRERAQRIFDRVSEAFHYLSHAQHAISDLMLDLSQPGPRVLTCRPILVEQSGYIRSNNIFTPNLVPEILTQSPLPATSRVVGSAAGNGAAGAAGTTSTPTQAGGSSEQQQQQQSPLSMQQRIDNELRTVFGAESAEEISAGAAEAAAAAAVVAGLVSTADRVEDPVDEPMVAPASSASAAAGDPQQQQPRPEMDEHAERSAEGDEAPTPRLRLYMPVRLPAPNPQVQMARLIQAVVNSATNDGDLHVEFNAPNIMSINLPVHVMTAAVHPPGGRPAAATTDSQGDSNTATATAAGGAATPTAAGAGAAAVGAASTSSGTRSGEQRANTLPTTATQTRSTSRPQIQIGGNNNWAGRIAPTHTAFDRFLPCNSHHIREPEPLPQNNNNNNNNSNNTNNNVNARDRESSSQRRAATNSTANALGESPEEYYSKSSRHTDIHTLIYIHTYIHHRTGSTTGIILANGVPAIVSNGSGNASSAPANRRGTLPPSQFRPMQRTLSRLISTMYDNFLVTNMRNHAQTADVAAGAAAGAAAAAAAAGAAATAATVAAAVGSVTGPSAVAGTGTATANASNTAGSSSIPAAAATATAAEAAQLVLSSEPSNLQVQLFSFLHHNLFEGAPINEETMPSAINRALNWFGDSLLYLPQYERPEYNSRDSVCNTLRQSLRLVIELCSAPAAAAAAAAVPRAGFEQQLKQICEQFRKRLYSVLFLCLGSANAELYWRQLMRLLCVPLRSNFRNEALQFLCIYIDPTIPALTDTADAQQFLVLRNVQSALPTDANVSSGGGGGREGKGINLSIILMTNSQQPFVAPPPLAFPSQQPLPAEQLPLDNDVEMADVASSSNSSSATDLEPPLPTVAVGSEPWHSNFPNDWLPVITRDLQTQSEQPRSQPPYSDAYISGMSAKRRKIIQSEMPSPSVECLIASGVQRAIQSTGLAAAANAAGGGGNPAVNPDVVIGAIAHDAVVQASYTEAVRNNARERLKQDLDYKPSKYPQIAKFTEQK